MRGVFLRGRRLPANRSAGPARPPVVPAAVPRRSRRSCVQRLGRRPQDRARRAVPTPSAARSSITTRNSAAHESAARGTRFARGHSARWRPVHDRDNDSCPGIGRQPVTCTDSRCRQPSSASAVPCGRWRASPHRSCPRLASRRRARPRPRPARRASAHPGSWTGRPAQARIAGPRGSMPRHAPSPVRPPISHRFRGAVATA